MSACVSPHPRVPGDEFRKVEGCRAVTDYEVTEDYVKFTAKTHGNATLFGAIRRADSLRQSNVSTTDDGNRLVVNAKVVA